MPSGQIRLYRVPGPRGDIQGIAIDTQGRIYVGESEASLIVVRSPTGVFQKYAIKGKNVTSLNAGARGEVWFAGDNSLGEFHIGGRTVEYELSPHCSSPVSLIRDRNDKPWFVSRPNYDRSRICHLSDTGRIEEVSVPSAAGAVGGVALASDGDIWFSADRAVGHIQQGGHVVAYVIPQSSFPWTYTPTTAGGLIITAADRNLWLQTTVPGGTGFGENAALGKFVIENERQK